MQKAILEIKNLTAGYKKNILENINGTAYRGEIIGIFGRNGCGKTTLLNALVGMPVIKSGSICIGGKNAEKMSVSERASQISLLAQRTPELHGITVREIMELGAFAIRGADKGKILKTASGLGIAELLDKDFAKLSEGQRQLVMIGKLLVQDSEILLLDEPDSSLDYINSELLFELMREMKKAGKTVLMVVHNPETVVRECDRIWFVEDGHLTEISSETLWKKIGKTAEANSRKG